MEHVEKGEYNLIIGSDASGRIPTLVFRGVINRLYQKFGYQLPKTIFLAGAGMSLKDEPEPEFVTRKKQAASEYIKGLKPEGALIVEDTLVKGSSIKFMCDVLAERGDTIWCRYDYQL